MKNKMKYDKKIQLLIIGNSAVGKTSILRRYAKDDFSPVFSSTIGLDFFNKENILKDKRVFIRLWDTVGQERFKSIPSSLVKNVDGVILAYDVTDKSSFDDLFEWLKSIKSNIGENNKKIIIIGNKIDLEREVNKEEANNFANSNNIKYFECSALTGENVNESINYLVEFIMEEINGKNKIMVNLMNCDSKDTDNVNDNDKNSIKLSKEVSKTGNMCYC